MSYQSITVRPCTANIGAEIDGIDLCQPIGNQQFQELHDALMEHQVLFFRDQPVTVDQQTLPLLAASTYDGIALRDTAQLECAP